jgi:hypothetical protein
MLHERQLHVPVPSPVQGISSPVPARGVAGDWLLHGNSAGPAHAVYGQGIGKFPTIDH